MSTLRKGRKREMSTELNSLQNEKDKDFMLDYNDDNLSPHKRKMRPSVQLLNSFYDVSFNLANSSDHQKTSNDLKFNPNILGQSTISRAVLSNSVNIDSISSQANFETLIPQSLKIAPKQKPIVNRNNLLGRMEQDFKSHHPDFSIDNYLTKKQAIYHLERIRVSQSPCRIPYQHLEYLKQLKRQLLPKSPSQNLKEQQKKKEQFYLPKIKKYEFQQKAKPRKMPNLELINQFDSSAVQPKSPPIHINNMYKSLFQCQNGRLILNKKKKSNQQRLKLDDKLTKASQVLTNYYNSRWQQDQPANSIYNMNGTQYYKNYKLQSLERSPRQKNSDYTAQNSIVLRQRTLDIVSSINEIDSTLNQQIIKTQQMINQDNFGRLKKQIAKREKLMVSDITNILLLVHDEAYVKQFKENIEC